MIFNGTKIGLDQPFFLIAGPCVIESEELQLRTAERLKAITDTLGILFLFKSSFDKANRSSGTSFRGPGMDEGLRILEKVRAELGVPVLTDVHDIAQVGPVAEVVDMLQTPAFLARQTDFIQAVASAGKPVNIKKAQFMAPHDMKNVVDKARAASIAAGGDGSNILVCERGASFGYNNLVSDMRSLAIMRETGAPVVFDATHSVQLPGGMGSSSGGQSVDCGSAQHSNSTGRCHLGCDGARGGCTGVGTAVGTAVGSTATTTAGRQQQRRPQRQHEAAFTAACTTARTAACRSGCQGLRAGEKLITREFATPHRQAPPHRFQAARPLRLGYRQCAPKLWPWSPLGAL